MARLTDAPPPTRRRIREERGDGREHRRAAEPAGHPERAQQQAGEDRDVAAGDGDDVIRPRFLQPPLDFVAQPGAIAKHDGGDDRGGTRMPPANGVCDRATREGPDGASISRRPRAPLEHSTSAPLLTVPTSVVPRRASARSWSGTPGSRYLDGRRSCTGIRTRRPARQSPMRSAASEPTTVTRTPPLDLFFTGAEAPPPARTDADAFRLRSSNWLRATA